MSQKLRRVSQSSPQISLALRQRGKVTIRSQPGSTAKAAKSLERFCPSLSMVPVLAIVKMVAGNCPGIRIKARTPMERLCQFRRPGQVEFNKRRLA